MKNSIKKRKKYLEKTYFLVFSFTMKKTNIIIIN